MQTRHRLPFQDLQPQQWINLALAGVLALYVFYIIWELSLGRLCSQIGVDFCDYWSAGAVASAVDYPSIYDLKALDPVQKSILPTASDQREFAVVPFPYLPVFVPPFQVLAMFPPAAGFGIWSVINLALLFWYLRFLSRSVHQRTASTHLLITMAASLPVFLNLFTGQMSVWLVIGLGEFMRAAVAGKSFRAGLWLGGLLLKPQVLVLIAPLLLLHRSWRVLAGLAACSLAVVLASVLLVGKAGLTQMLSLWRAYGEGRASNWVEGMMNWRMLQLHLSTMIPAWAAWAVAAAGIALTAAVVVYTWRRPITLTTSAFPVAMLGILAATASIAWHSHIHMAMILLPPMILLCQSGILPPRALQIWALAPAAVFLLSVFVPPALARMQIIADPGASYVYFLIGAAQLAVNLYLMCWAVQTSQRSA